MISLPPPTKKAKVVADGVSPPSEHDADADADADVGLDEHPCQNLFGPHTGPTTTTMTGMVNGNGADSHPKNGDGDERTFTACHILSGHCDESLIEEPDNRTSLGRRRGRAVIGLWLNDEDEDDEDGCKDDGYDGGYDYHGPNEDQNRELPHLDDTSDGRSASQWSLECTRSILHRYHRDVVVSHSSPNNVDIHRQVQIFFTTDTDTSSANATATANSSLLTKPTNPPPIGNESHDTAYATQHGQKEENTAAWSQLLRHSTVSLAHVMIANDLIDHALTGCRPEHQEVDETTSKSNPTDDGDERHSPSHILYQQAKAHLYRALGYWPCNPSALVCMANLIRMGVVDTDDVMVGHVSTVPTDAVIITTTSKTTATAEIPINDGTNEMTSLSGKSRHPYCENHGGGDDRTRGDGRTRRRLEMALQCYLAAAKCAYLAETLCRAALDGNNEEENDDCDDDANDEIGITNDDKYLLETILTEGAQMEEATPYEDNDDDENNNDNDEEEEDDVADDNDIEDDKDGLTYGRSRTLVTASYMSAMLASTLGYHEIAKDVLFRFSSGQGSDVITRIHPNVWRAAAISANATDVPSMNGTVSHTVTNSKSDTTTKPTQGSFVPLVFPKTVPQDLFEKLRHAFRPNAPYWKESQYDRNVYYSFWTDWPLPKGSSRNNTNSYVVSNVVEHYVVSQLLPRIKAISSSRNTDGLDHLKGFEWWVHTRPHGANLGHQLHFDTDEALLDQDGTVEYPISASVTYLTLDDIPHGATVIFDQTSTSKESAGTAWICKPRSKSFIVFPGDLLHGVLPCISTEDTPSRLHGEPHKGDTGSIVHSLSSTPPHRLTFMVNFWAYRIPDRINKRRLYGPSGPFPPPTKDHSWTQDICDGYPQTIEMPVDPISPAANDTEECLVSVSPAWETLTATSNSMGRDEQGILPEWAFPSGGESPLPIPSSGGINQRFFVRNAPEYFHSTLFEK